MTTNNSGVIAELIDSDANNRIDRVRLVNLTGDLFANEDLTLSYDGFGAAVNEGDTWYNVDTGTYSIRVEGGWVTLSGMGGDIDEGTY